MKQEAQEAKKVLEEGVGSALDAYFVYKFLRALTKAWTEMDAFKLGIIDASGNRLKKNSELSSEEKNSATYFDRLVWNIKRLLEKIPGGKTKLMSYAAAAFLIKENSEEVKKALREEAPINTVAGVENKDQSLKPIIRRKPKDTNKKEEDMENVKEDSPVISLNKLLLKIREGRRMAKVVRGGKLMKKVKCSPDQTVVDGKCVTKTAKDKMMFRKRSKKTQRTLAGKSQGAKIRKMQKSDRKRTALGL
jgi:hypothetical protein